MYLKRFFRGFSKYYFFVKLEMAHMVRLKIALGLQGKWLVSAKSHVRYAKLVATGKKIKQKLTLPMTVPYLMPLNS